MRIEVEESDFLPPGADTALRMEIVRMAGDRVARMLSARGYDGMLAEQGELIDQIELRVALRLRKVLSGEYTPGYAAKYIAVELLRRVDREMRDRHPGFQPAGANRLRGQQALIDGEMRGKPYHQDRIFKDYMLDRHLPPEGWKLHVSASPEHSGTLAKTCLPVLRAMGVFHKIVGDIDDYEVLMDEGQTGKLITIYPDTPEVAKEVAKRLDLALAISGIQGPEVDGEMPIGESGLIFARYGGFTKSTVFDPTKGVEVEDVRGHVHPPWIKNPFIDDDPYTGFM